MPKTEPLYRDLAVTDDERIEKVIFHLDQVLMQLDHMANRVQAERRELFRLLMQFKGKDA